MIGAYVEQELLIYASVYGTYNPWWLKKIGFFFAAFKKKKFFN
jgi:hypothetical protein